jgi:hypothetical protein
MKRLFIFLLFISVCYLLSAQKSSFVRAYNLNGRKIDRGNVVAATDTSLQIKGKEGDTVNLSISGISKLKTKRSAGHNLLIGAVAGAGAAGILGAATAQPDAFMFAYTAGEGAAAGAVLGLPLGAAIGGISLLFKKSNALIINGDIEKWKAVRSELLIPKGVKE